MRTSSLKRYLIILLSVAVMFGLMAGGSILADGDTGSIHVTVAMTEGTDQTGYNELEEFTVKFHFSDEVYPTVNGGEVPSEPVTDYETTLTAGGEITLGNIPVDVTYWVWEDLTNDQESSGYSRVSIDDPNAGDLVAGRTAEVTINLKYEYVAAPQYGSLTISMAPAPNSPYPVPSDELFSFTVDIAGWVTQTVTLYAGESTTITDIPADSEYTVTLVDPGIEYQARGYVFTRSGTSGTIATGQESAASYAVAMTNAQITYDVTWFGATGNDLTADDQAFASAMFRALYHDEHIIVQVPAGTYYFSDRIPIFSDTSLILDENATVIATYSGTVSMVTSSHARFDSEGNYAGYCYGTGCTHGGSTQTENITISGGTWDRGSNTASDKTSVFIFRHAGNITISNTTVRHCTDHFINVSGCDNVTISGVNFEDACRCTGGLSSTFWEGFDSETDRRYYYIEAIHTDYMNSAGENSDWARPFDNTPTTNLTVTNCTFSNVMAGIGTHHPAGDQNKRGANYTITDNTFTGVLGYCLYADDFDHVTFTGNTCSDCNSMALVYGSTDVTIARNTLSSTHGGSTDDFGRNIIFFSGTSTGSITDNTITGARKAGIQINSSCSGINVEGNTISNSGEYGILAANSEGITLNNNTVSGTGSGFSAIRIENLTGTNKVTNNTVRRADQDGIDVINVGSPRISGNRISGIGRRGIWVSRSKYATIADNTISSAPEVGIFIEGVSSDNTSGRATVTGNTVSSPGSSGIQLKYAGGSTVSNNMISGAGNDGINAADCQNCTMSTNTINRTTRRGISLTRCKGTVISDSYIGNTGDVSVFSEGTSSDYTLGRVTVRSNTIESSASGKDAVLIKYGDGSAINANIITNAGRRAININTSAGCEIDYNEISGTTEIPVFISGTSDHKATANVRFNTLQTNNSSSVDLRAGDYSKAWIYGNTFRNSKQYSNASTGSITVLGPTALPFTDVRDPNKFYFDPVYWAYYSGITNGTTSTTFSPDKPCTREQIITFIWRAMGSPMPQRTAYNAYFTDLASNGYYVNAVNWAKEAGVCPNGLNDGSGRFGVGNPCTRAMCVTFLYRAAGSPGVTNSIRFNDVRSNNYFYNPVRWAVANGITTGTTSTTFSPDGTVTRAQTVTFIYRFINR